MNEITHLKEENKKMKKVVESYYLGDRYTVDWDAVDKWFDERKDEIFKEGLKEKR